MEKNQIIELRIEDMLDDGRLSADTKAVPFL